MFKQQLRKSGDSYIVTIPKDEVNRLNLREGQMIAIDVTPMELKPLLRPEIAEVLQRTSEIATPVMKYLRDK